MDFSPFPVVIDVVYGQLYGTSNNKGIVCVSDTRIPEGLRLFRLAAVSRVRPPPESVRLVWNQLKVAVIVGVSRVSLPSLISSPMEISFTSEAAEIPASSRL